MRYQIFFLTVAGLFLTSCGEVVQQEKILCDCDSNWRVSENNISSFYIKGNCIIDIDDDGHRIKESYRVKIYYEPQQNLYFQGDHDLLGKAIILGSNSDEFWLWIRHKEVSSYWFGDWNKMDSSSLLISPDIIFEAMGISSNSTDEYKIEDGYYVFQQGSKKKYYSCCDGLLEKIEVIGSTGQVVSICNLSGYFQPVEGKDFTIASNIEIITFNKSGNENKINLKLKKNSFKKKEFNDKFRGRFFSRPVPKGAKNIYEIGG